MMQELGAHQLAWVEALESDDYTQNFGCLETSGGYCCLGIACKISGLDFDGGDHYMPLEVRDYFGFVSEEGSSRYSADDALPALNDDKRLTFSEIAQIVRSNPSNYFTESK